MSLMEELKEIPAHHVASADAQALLAKASRRGRSRPRVALHARRPSGTEIPDRESGAVALDRTLASARASPPGGNVDSLLARDGVRQMRWTGSAMRVFALVAGVVLAVGATAPAGTAVGLAASDAGGREYQVQPGDTLWAIAGSRLGDPYRWPEIAAASASIVQPGGVRLSDPDLVRPGWTLILTTETDTQPPPTVLMSGMSGATSVAAGADSACAVVAGGQVACWGWNYEGQLGDGSTQDSATPVRVSGVSGATAVAAGADFACAVVSGGKVTCWGANGFGQLGDGSTRGKCHPGGGVRGVRSHRGGRRRGFACAVVAGGKVTCWGSNNDGQLGDGTYQAFPVPVRVSGVSGVTGAAAVTAGTNYACALIAGGKVTCWGEMNYEHIENIGGGLLDSTIPVLVSGVSGATSVAAGSDIPVRWSPGGRSPAGAGTNSGSSVTAARRIVPPRCGCPGCPEPPRWPQATASPVRWSLGGRSPAGAGTIRASSVTAARGTVPPRCGCPGCPGLPRWSQATATKATPVRWSPGGRAPAGGGGRASTYELGRPCALLHQDT